MSEQSNTKEALESTLRLTKETLAEEIKRFVENFLYLVFCLSVLETYRSLVLLQFDINQFGHGYLVAITASLIMAKLVTLAQRIKFFEIFDSKPLIYPVLFRSIMMTICVAIFKVGEELIFSTNHVIPQFHATVLTLTHYLGTTFVFFVLFTVRGLDQKLGKGTLSRLFFGLGEAPKE